LGAGRELVRAAANWVMPRLPSVRRTLREAHAVLVSNLDTLERLRAIHPREYVLMPANAVDLGEMPPYEPAGDVLELVAVGALVPMRPYRLVLEALARLDDAQRRRVRLTFVGDGPDRRQLERRARRLGLAPCVRFTGPLTRAETLLRMRQAHLLVFPSLRDSGSSAVAEALAMGLPVLALRLAGPGSMLAEGGGIVAEAQTSSQVVQGVRRTVAHLLEERAVLGRTSSAGLSAAAKLLHWQTRIARVDAVYRERSAAEGRA
jgi:glycosyltransferase involved in cell wall biosynthesis